MTDTPPSNAPAAPSSDDARFGFAAVTEAGGALIHSVPDDSLDGPTPCAEWNVATLLDHIVMVMRRTATIGRGEHWSSVQQESLSGLWATAYGEAAHGVMEAWTDPAKLQKTWEVPWGQLSGAAVIATYTAEFAVHGWDLATATSTDFTVEDDVLGAALVAAKHLPAEGRGLPDVPFDPVVDPGADAPILLQIAGWLGREVV